MTSHVQLTGVLDAALEGWAIAEAIRDETGQIADFRLTYLNEAGGRILGRSPEAIVGRRCLELWPNLANDGLIEAYAQAVTSRRPMDRTFFYDDGELVGQFEVRVRPFNDGFAACFANVTDVPDGSDWSNTEVRLRAALDTAFDGFLMLSPTCSADGAFEDFVVDYINEFGAKLSGAEPSELVGRELARLGPAAIAALRPRYEHVIRTGEAYEAEVTDPSADTVWEVRASRVAENVVAISYRDVTGRVRHERRALASEADARLAAERIAALQSVTAALARAGQVADVYGVMTEQVRPFAAWESLVVMLLEEDRLVVSYASGLTESAQRALRDAQVDDRYPMSRVVRDRLPLFYRSPEEYLHDYPERAEQLAEAGRGAWAFIPLMSAGRPIGAMSLGYHARQDFTDREREALVSLGELYAQALERARLYEAQRSIAADLQRALLPAALPGISGARHAARYLPWTEGADVGGDWYDIIPLDSGAVGVVIGDVAGHSASAAATMGQVRNALRAYALDGNTPTSVMERLNRLLLRVDPLAIATCCYLELHLDEGTATAVLAGHPPPILCDQGKARPLGLRLSVPLGVTPTPRYVDTTLLLPPSSALLLYTDGLVEDRRHRIDDGLAQLAAALTGEFCNDPAELVERVLAAGIGPHPRSDDVALLAITVDAAEGGTPVAARQFRGDASNAAAARRFAADVLVAWGLGHLVDTARLLLGEIITNAVQHTVGDVAVRLTLNDPRLRVEVRDNSDRVPDLQVAEPDSESGRGLQIVATLADDWGHEMAGPGGKVVWFELTR
jgi:serine phosphatase RsbU (regulator of sigma subunit)/PAS domain-containing protein/anti-sigma regulatory factor (Ser/Thr protein kinase)